MTSALIADPAQRSSSQSSTSPTTASRLSRIVAVAWPRLRRSWVSASAVRAASGKRCAALEMPDVAAGGRDAEVGAHVGRPASVLARISARCTARTPASSRDRPPPMCIRHEASPAVTTSAPVSSTAPHLVGQHRGRGVGVLDREGAAEPAARVGRRQLDQVEPAHRAQQPQRLVADAQQPQRVAGRVVGHPMRVRRADVLDAEHVDEQLGQLERLRRNGFGPLGRARSSPARRATSACWWRTEPDARPGRRHDRLAALGERPLEHLDVVPDQAGRVARVAGVGVHLAAAGLVGREHHLVAEPLEHGDRRLARRRGTARRPGR